ncbi:CRISPR-associated helicase Cas3' [Hyphomicrobium sp. D-2]|uniref:CRISPR-associated helicase Cas3' n=1 Tax=Hyphomicrobium sp. D-2 TaxID=3041621 RepID=UPI00245669DC|nr:CRISPR-associated helicase Cas3' [Hyphomicrobium sp. D-2]MDH4981172.1 CRISPR-associated helicase Cas3' [Hyphomicrobium sp. D-2]
MINKLWAKLERAETDFPGRKWLSLVDHSADVAAVFEAVLQIPLVTRRLAALADRGNFPPIWRSRLCAHVALHDFGKANHGFQARRDPKAPAVGHVLPGLGLLYSAYQPDLASRLAATLMFEELAAWGAGEAAIRAVAAHHGRPISQQLIDGDGQNQVASLWAPLANYDPIAALAPLAQAIRNDWFSEAFKSDDQPLPDAPRFWHAVSGFVMLADWIGSDANAFPLYIAPATDGMARIANARAIAPQLLAAYGFDPAAKRKALPAVSFASVSEHEPRPIQKAVGDVEGQVVILEAETGSGKTEAALYRFARLFERGEVDGLYFALPTRVAAKSIEERIREAVQRIFPSGARPSVILAVPGYAKSDGVGYKTLPDFDVQWDDGPDANLRRERWAAEHPKRFLAGTISVGTIDQALLGAIQARHAHMRSSSLLRHLLVVDEVHASDVYMERLLVSLLDQHTSAGGHALLLSATLGSTARHRLLGLTSNDDQSLAELSSAHYPAISTSQDPEPKHFDGSGRTKQITLNLDPRIGDPVAIARLALEAAEKGAKVLVIRNLQHAAVATAEALFALAPNHPALFRCEGVPTLHHGRFAREDRELLDAIIGVQMQEARGTKGLVLIGTQTLEQSLDICADFMITDLCPADVLLQRIGRLHRHAKNARPAGFEAPRLVVLSPDDLAPLLSQAQFGMGGGHGPYRDLVMLEATRRLVRDNPTWTIAQMNRTLVEQATHPHALEALTCELEKVNPAWRGAGERSDGQKVADTYLAQHVLLPWKRGFSGQIDLAFPMDERTGTRLGADDVLVPMPEGTIGPFGHEIRVLTIPSRWLPGVDLSADLVPQIMPDGGAALKFNLGSHRFCYDALGLRKLKP